MARYPGQTHSDIEVIGRESQATFERLIKTMIVLHKSSLYYFNWKDLVFSNKV